MHDDLVFTNGAYAPDQVIGFVARGQDTDQLRTPQQLRDGLGLTPPLKPDGTPAWTSPIPTDGSYAYQLTWQARTNRGLSVPYGAPEGAAVPHIDNLIHGEPRRDGEPFTGTGTTSGGIPEWHANRAPVTGPAQIWHIDKSGNRSLYAEYDPSTRTWKLTPLINVIPNENQDIVVYQGQVATNVRPGQPGDRALIINGTRVPHDEFDAWYTERMVFDCRGQPFGLERYRDGRVHGTYAGKNGPWARDNNLEGNQYEGWRLNVPESEIENLRVEKIDILERERYRLTFKVDPPEDLFTYVRPATDQEWIRE